MHRAVADRVCGELQPVLDGQLDDVRIYDRPLSDFEVKGLYLSGNGLAIATLSNQAIQLSIGTQAGLVYWIQSSTNLADWTAIHAATGTGSVLQYTNADLTASVERHGEGRHQLTVVVSEDEGRTWKVKKYLDKSPPREGNYGYPTAIQSRNGRVHVTYTHDVQGGKSIKHVEVDSAWLAQ